MKHQAIDQRSLAMHSIISERLRRDPTLLDLAKKNLERWLATCSPRSRSTLAEWQAILDRGLEPALEVLLSTDENSTRLRQSSPFAGEEFITRDERSSIILDAVGRQ